MSSVRRLKQKGLAFSGSPAGADHRAPRLWRGASWCTAYDYRKAAFATLPPATTVRPLRAVRNLLIQAEDALARAVRRYSGVDFCKLQQLAAPELAGVHFARNLYRAGRRHAARGDGTAVHRVYPW